MGLVRFAASKAGRAIRIIVGIILIVLGLIVVTGTGGIIIAIIGLGPLLSGILNFCVIAPLFNAPFWGKDVK